MAKKTTKASKSAGASTRSTKAATDRTTRKTKTAKKTTKAAAARTTKKSSKKTAKKTTRKTAATKAGPASKKTAKKTTAKTTKKTTKAPGVTAAASPKAAKEPRRIKTHLSAKELRYYRSLLLEKRTDLVGDLNGLAESALRGQDRSNLSNMPLHMADAGSDNYDQELALGLMESERELLNDIDDALDRIENKTYGICIATGEPINKARLEIKPWAKFCIEAARQHERGNSL